MTPLLLDQLGSLQACLQRVTEFGCIVEFFAGELTDKPLVRVAAPTSELLDHLDAQQIRIGNAFGLMIAELDGCAVAWRASTHMRVDEVEHIELRS